LIGVPPKLAQALRRLSGPLRQGLQARTCCQRACEWRTSSAGGARVSRVALGFSGLRKAR
jgi:hypothetical protein